jgi:hypothetical protein
MFYYQYFIMMAALKRLFEELMSRKIVVSLFLLCFISIGTISGIRTNYAIKNDVEFAPDTSINGKLFLRAPNSLNYFFINEFEMTPNSENQEFPAVFFCSIDSNKYVALYHYYGDLKNQYSLFEVGYCDSIQFKVKYNFSHYNDFFTESKIRLGMTKKELINRKGENFKIRNVGKQVILKYIVDDMNSVFLKRYNMPVYFAEYYIVNNKIFKFRFGFEYP